MRGYKLRKLLNTIKTNWRVAVVVVIMMSISGYILAAYGMKKHYIVEAELYVESTDEMPHAEKADKAAMLFTSPRMFDAINENLQTRFSYTELYKMISVSQRDDTQIIVARFDCQTGSDAYRLAEITLKLTQRVLNEFDANADIRIVTPPVEPTMPEFPDEQTFTIGGGIIGAIISIIGIIIIWKLDNTITHADNITEEYGLPVLGELMDFDTQIDYLGR